MWGIYGLLDWILNVYVYIEIFLHDGHIFILWTIVCTVTNYFFL